MLYVDIPSLADLKSVAAHRDDICVSIYLPTTPVSREAASDRIELKNLAKESIETIILDGHWEIVLNLARAIITLETRPAL